MDLTTQFARQSLQVVYVDGGSSASSQRRALLTLTATAPPAEVA
jgi:hypothetical protein